MICVSDNVLDKINVEKIIDVHVHLYPNDIVPRFYAWIEKKHKLKAKMPIEWDKTLERLNKMGVSNVFNLTHAIIPEYTQMLNEWQGFLKEKYGFITFGAFHPENDDELLIEAFEKGWIDGLKLHPPVQKFKPNSKEALRIYELLEELKKPLLIHSGWFPDNSFEYADAGMYDELIFNYSFPVILAHMLLGKTKEIEVYLDARRNIFTETSNALVEMEVIENGKKILWYCEDVKRIIEEFSDRVLYGSEIPLVWWEPEETLFNLLKLDIDDKIKEKVLYKNAERFIERYL